MDLGVDPSLLVSGNDGSAWIWSPTRRYWCPV